MRMSEETSYVLGTFKDRVGEKFRLRFDDGIRTVELIEAVGQMGQVGDDSRNFALVFRDPESSPNAYLQQSSYPFEHDELGELSFFVVPIGPGKDGIGIDYEAVFAAPY